MSNSNQLEMMERIALDLEGVERALASSFNTGSEDFNTLIRPLSEAGGKRLRAQLCLLIDGRHPEMPIDKVAFDWLVEAGVPLQIVVTKVDKLNAKEKSVNLAKIKAMYPTDSPPIMYSSLKHTGRELLQQRINQVLVGEEA